MGGFLQDVRRGGRMILRHRGFFATVITTMTVGIASLAAVFSVVYGVLLEPLPYPESDELVSIQSEHAEYGGNILNRVATFDAFRRASRTTADLAAVEVGDLQIRTAAGRHHLTAMLATPSIFHLLGAEAVRGRLFEEPDGRFGEARVAVLSHRLWAEALNRDRDVVGRTLRFVGDPVLGCSPGEEGSLTVVGVLPESVRAPFGRLDPDLWIAESFDERRGSLATHVMAFARLADGVSLAAAQEELGGVYRRVQAASGEPHSPWRTRLVPLRQFLVGSLERPLHLVFLGGLIVLLVAAANTAILLVARAEVRASEAAIRTALGAGRHRLIRQLVAENFLPATLTGGLGLLGAWVLLRIFDVLGTGWLPQRFDVGLDAPVLLLVIGVTLGTQALFALSPAVRFSRIRLTPCINAWGGRRGGANCVGRFGLVALQVALALVLTVASSLLVQSVRHLSRVDPGFAKDQALTGRISLPPTDYAESRHRRDFHQRLLAGIGGLPGVTAAGMTSYLPFSGGSAATEIAVEGAVPGSSRETVQIQFRAVTHGYLEAMGIPLLAGRGFDAGDLTRPVVIVSDKAARMLWGGRDPLGKRVKLGGEASRNPWADVVGVVGDVQHDSLTQDREPTLYLPFLAPERMALVVRSANGRPELLAPAIRETLEELDPEQPLLDVQTMSTRVASGFWGIRSTAWLISLLAGITLLLAAIGVYGATYHAVVQKRREIGVRYALGAVPRDILCLVCRSVAPWLAGGLIVGMLGALALGRYLSSLLFGVGSADPAVLLTACVMILGVTLLGICLPTRRASKVDPATVLKA